MQHSIQLSQKFAQTTSQRTHDMETFGFWTLSLWILRQKTWLCPLCWKMNWWNYQQTAAWSFSSHKLTLVHCGYWLPVNIPRCQNGQSNFCCLSPPPIYVSQGFPLWLSENQRQGTSWKQPWMLLCVSTAHPPHHDLISLFPRSKPKCFHYGSCRIQGFRGWPVLRIKSLGISASFFILLKICITEYCFNFILQNGLYVRY